MSKNTTITVVNNKDQHYFKLSKITSLRVFEEHIKFVIDGATFMYATVKYTPSYFDKEQQYSILDKEEFIKLRDTLTEHFAVMYDVIEIKGA